MRRFSVCLLIATLTACAGPDHDIPALPDVRNLDIVGVDTLLPPERDAAAGRDLLPVDAGVDAGADLAGPPDVVGPADVADLPRDVSEDSGPEVPDPTDVAAWEPEGLGPNPRLFFSAEDLPALRERAAAIEGPHAALYATLRNYAAQEHAANDGRAVRPQPVHRAQPDGGGRRARRRARGGRRPRGQGGRDGRRRLHAAGGDDALRQLRDPRSRGARGLVYGLRHHGRQRARGRRGEGGRARAAHRARDDLPPDPHRAHLHAAERHRVQQSPRQVAQRARHVRARVQRPPPGGPRHPRRPDGPALHLQGVPGLGGRRLRRGLELPRLRRQQLPALPRGLPSLRRRASPPLQGRRDLHLESGRADRADHRRRRPGPRPRRSCRLRTRRAELLPGRHAAEHGRRQPVAPARRAARRAVRRRPLPRQLASDGQPRRPDAAGDLRHGSIRHAKPWPPDWGARPMPRRGRLRAAALRSRGGGPLAAPPGRARHRARWRRGPRAPRRHEPPALGRGASPCSSTPATSSGASTSASATPRTTTRSSSTGPALPTRPSEPTSASMPTWRIGTRASG